MRASLRGEDTKRTYVGIGRIEALRRIEIDEGELRIGAAATHAELAAFLQPYGEFRVLTQAATHSANPAVRNMATIGGNLCTSAFPAADLVPALLCLDAAVEIDGRRTGAHRMGVEAFLGTRDRLDGGCLLTRVIIRRRPRLSVHVRLPLRKAGDYAVAIVSASFAVGGDGRLAEPRITVGSVEPAARRWTELEERLGSRAVDPSSAANAAAESTSALKARDGIEAPAWYRLQVLPALVRRAVEDIRRGM